MADTENPLKFARKIGVRYPGAVASDGLNGKFGGITRPGCPTVNAPQRNAEYFGEAIVIAHPQSVYFVCGLCGKRAAFDAAAAFALFL